MPDNCGNETSGTLIIILKIILMSKEPDSVWELDLPDCIAHLAEH